MIQEGDRTFGGHIEEAKKLASTLMHMHYCENDTEGVTACFAPQISWLGAGEEEYVSGREACVERFLNYKGALPKCNISEEEYDVVCPADGVYIVTGRMWIETDPSAGMYLRVHQRVTYVFQETEDGLKCAHIHCSNPYEEMVGGEKFPDKIGKQSYEYIQEQLSSLEEEVKQRNRQLEVIMSSIAGGLKISNDDDTYSFAFVSREAAALFGYTVEEFMEATGGSAVGNVYPPDLPKALADCAEAFKDGGLVYSTKYRVRCKDGSFKWVIDSGKKARDADGNWMVNSLYLDITRSEEDAQRLREQTGLLTSIYETVPCGIIRFVRHRDNSFSLISLNRAVIEIMGYADMETGCGDWHDGVMGAVLKEDRKVLYDIYSMLQDVGDRRDCEYRVRRMDGSIRWMDGTSMIVGVTPDGDDILQRTVVDATERKILQQRLDREHEMYRVAMEVSSAVMFEYLMDEDRFISYEPRTGQGVIRNEIRDYSKELLKHEIVHPDDVATVIDNICNGRSEVFEVRCSTPGGRPGEFVWHRVNSRLMTEEGRPDRVVGALNNIHKMKSKLSESSERLRMNQSALQAINDVYVSIFYVDLQKDSYYAVRLPEAGRGNTMARTGCYSEELYGYILQDVVDADRGKVADICERDSILRELAQRNGHLEVEFRNRTSSYWIRMEVHLTAAGGGSGKTAIFAFRNISAEKQRELEYYEEEKKAKCALEEAYASVNRANQAKSDFLSRMSHDIRTPMNAIMGMAEIARNSTGDEKRIADCLSKIDLSGRHLLGLINEVLDMSKIESGNMSLSEDVIVLDSFLREVSEIVRPDVEQKSQHYTVTRKEGKHSAVYGDTVRLKQILINLLSNAVKYTQEGGHISVSLEEKLSGERGVGCFEFVVEDDGIGMSKEFIDKLFLPFERAEDSRVSQIQGTGLGMAITLNLVQMMNGTIQVDSRLDEGTKFTVTVYLKFVQAKGVPDSGKKEDRSRPVREFAPGMRVLLAEDNMLNREIVVDLLSMNGIAADCAVNGKEAVDTFIARPPGTYALILMDIQMPVMDGYSAARAIRSLSAAGGRPDAADIPIIALTANAFVDDAYRAKQAGMNEHVTKPLEIGRLLDIMHQLTDPPDRI